MVSCDSFQKCKPHTIDQGDEYRVNHSLNFFWKDFPNSENLSAQSVNSIITIHYSLLHSSTSPIWISTGNMRFFDKKVLRIKLPFFIKKWEFIFNYVPHVTLFGQLSHTQQITFHIRYIENIIDVPVITILQCDNNSPFSSHRNEPVITNFTFVQNESSKSTNSSFWPHIWFVQPVSKYQVWLFGVSFDVAAISTVWSSSSCMWLLSS